MQKRKKIDNQSGFHLIQVDIIDKYTDGVRTSYEVLDPQESVVGRFTSLTEAEGYIKLLCRLDQEA